MNSNEVFTKAFDFTGQTVVITGGAGVLGGEMAGALTACGAQVAILPGNSRTLPAQSGCDEHAWDSLRAAR